VDRDVQLIACGSSAATMPTYLVWDREVLEACYDQVDGLSLHVYYGNTPNQTGNSAARYLALNLDMEDQIQESAAVCDYVQGLQKSRKRLWLSFDEWNVWYRARGAAHSDGKKTFAPHLLEEVYNLEDALLVGGMLNTLIRNADRVRIGCLAQIVNVIAPIVATDQGVLLQSTYFPYQWANKYARGEVLDLIVESENFPIDPSGIQQPFARRTAAPYLDIVGTIDKQNNQAALLMLNRDLNGEREFTIDWRDVSPSRVLTCQTVTGKDLKAFNTFAAPNTVAPQQLDAPAAGARMTFKLPAGSYSVAHLALS
jgi:alpha-N-arabinofuranosidase